ncbi:hypothetical protein BHE74_00009270 [Ensete ventricosum]|nr:hypothetical protein BHE74_00009270 [Ensete ventricosum]
MSTGSKVHFDRLERKIRTNNVTFEHRKCTAAAEAMPWRGHKQLKPAGEMCRASELVLTQQCSKKLEKYTNLVDLKAPHVEAQCRVTGSNKKLKWLIMPAEEHDDAASDDVKPGLLLSQSPAEPSSLRHLPMAPHLHAGQHVDVLIPSSLSALQMERLQLGGFLWQRIEGLYRRRGGGRVGEEGCGGQGGGPTPEALALAGACTAPVLCASGHAPWRPYALRLVRVWKARPPACAPLPHLHAV